MKRIIGWLFVFIFLLAGCKSAVESPMPKEEFDIAGKKTVIYHGEQTFPLSLTVDGCQQIQSGTYWYYELRVADGEEMNENFYTYDVKNLELNGNRKFSNLGKKKCYATNGDWPLFLTPTHTAYKAKDQDQVDEKLKQLTNKQLSNHQMEQSAVLVTDVWSCDLDGNGDQELLFKACNCDGVEEGAKYCFLAYVKEDSMQVLYESFRPIGGAKPKIIKPMICDLEGDGNWEIVVFQQGDYKSFGVFGYKDGNIIKNYEILF